MGFYMDTRVGSYKSWWQFLVTTRDEYNRHPGNTNEFSGAAAEAAELSGWMGGASCFSCCSLFVLSYSGLGLLTLLFWGPSTEDSSVCCGTFRFGTQSTLSLLKDQVPNFSHHGKTFSWSNFFICAQNSSHLSHWEYSWVNQVLLISSTQKYCYHTTCPLDITL